MIGSSNDAKNVPVEKTANVMETLDASMAPKKVIQWSAMTKPATDNLRMNLGSIWILIFAILIYKKIKIDAIIILNHTKGIALMVMSCPRMAVKPAMNTKKCKWRWFFNLAFGISQQK